MKNARPFIMFFGLVAILSILFTSIPLPMISIAQEPGETCGENNVYDCDLNCVSEATINAAWSNFYCDEFLNCSIFNYDGGDCGPAIPNTGCGDGYSVYDCNLNCSDEGIMEMNLYNGVCDEYLNCSAFGFDMGACTTPGNTCGPGQVLDCDLNCVSETTINAAWSNFYCDEFLNCSIFNYDGGDCGPAIPNAGCGDGYSVYDCNLNCSDEGTMEMDLNNGVCDEYLNCSAFGFDMGACTTPGNTCGPGQVLDCDLNCVSETTASLWTGDGWCDDGAWGMDLVCEAFNFDGGDCSGPGNTCGPGQVLDCDLNCVSETIASSWTGDGWCDDGAWGMDLVCEAFNFDGGDCN